jgi:FtsZ-binding cell division protein ZapB
MQIRQFEKLQSLVNEAADQILKLKLENKRLSQQVSDLQNNVENHTNKNNDKLTEEIKRLKSENKALQEKQQVISSRLRKVLAKVKNLSEGVES